MLSGGKNRTERIQGLTGKYQKAERVEETSRRTRQTGWL